MTAAAGTRWRTRDCVLLILMTVESFGWTRQTQRWWTPYYTVCLRRSTTDHTRTHKTSHLLTRPLRTLPIWLWQRQRLSDISFHYGSSPCLHHWLALDEARATVNCQAELIGTWWRRWEWLGNWNELEWKNRMREWEDLELQCSFEPSECFS